MKIDLKAQNKHRMHLQNWLSYLLEFKIKQLEYYNLSLLTSHILSVTTDYAPSYVAFCIALNFITQNRFHCAGNFQFYINRNVILQEGMGEVSRKFYFKTFFTTTM